jgi:cyclopropane-fatty-acyl-phospholipid synthase
MSFLDPYNQYTCGYISDTEELNTAQEKKLQLICDKLQLKPTDRVLDIGCGWGGFCKYAAETIGCQVAGVSISNEQIAYAKDFCKGLPVDIQKKDYRDLNGTYDKILICGMIEHVGYKNYRRIMKKVYELLPDHGLFLLHTIGNSTSMHNTDPWIAKYIFPNSMIPSVTQLTGAAEGLFVMEDWHNFGIHYVSTLKAWCKNFEKNWDSIRNTYGDRFFRMWRYYLLSCAGYFDSRKGQLWQVVFSKRGVPGGYYSLR